QWAKPTTVALAAENEVFGLARFGDAAARAELESAGVTCIRVELAAAAFSAVPNDVDGVLNLAVAKTKSFDHDLAANAESVGLLMQHSSSVEGFLHFSQA